MENSLALTYYKTQPRAQNPQVVDADICVYGGHSGGVVAAIQAARMGKKVVIVEFGGHLGGLTASGLGATDIGRKGAIGGISREFYERIAAHYADPAAWKSESAPAYFAERARQDMRRADPVAAQNGRETQWTFEPHVAERLFETMAHEAGVPVYFEQPLAKVRKDGNRITAIETLRGDVFRAQTFIDASYEGDLLALAGVSFHVGRESNSTYGETLNGVQFQKGHNFSKPVDPFVVPGQPASGLLSGISPQPPGEMGEGDHLVQAYNFRLCLTQAADRLPFPRPANYDAERYELLARYIEAGVCDALNLTVWMPNLKTDTNNCGGFSSDNIGENHEWPAGDYPTRERIFQDHVTYQQGLMYFLANDARLPQSVRDDAGRWGLPADEFPATGGWPWQLYVREGRRMISDYVMTEHECRGTRRVEDSVGLAAYTMDSHHCQRIARQENGVWTALNEGCVEVGGFPPYPVSFRAIMPAEGECSNLLVPFCLSSSHIAFGSIRMEPVYMVLGQSAATAAVLAQDAHVPVQRLDYALLRERLERDGQILDWDATS